MSDSKSTSSEATSSDKADRVQDAVSSQSVATEQIASKAEFLIPNRGVHFAFVIVRSLRIVMAALAAVVAGGIEGIIKLIRALDASPLIWVGIVLGVLVFLLAIVTLWQYFAWKHFSWEVTTTELTIYSGIIFRKKEHIALARIHSIDHRQSLTQRILGVVELKVVTAGAARQREARISGLTLAEAEQLSQVIFAQKRVIEEGESAAPRKRAGIIAATKEALSSPNAWVQPEPQVAGDDLAASVARVSDSVRGIFGGAAEDRSDTEFEYHVSTKDLFLTGLSSNNAFYFWFIIPFILLGLTDMFGLTQTAFRYLAGFRIVLIVAVIAVVLVVGWIVSVGHALLSYGGFTVRRRGARIEIERGLLERHSVGIALDRVQSVRVRRGLIRRIIGYAEVVVDTVQGITTEGKTERAAIVHPFIKSKEVDTFIAQLLPEFAERPEATTPLPKRALPRLIFRSTFWFTLFATVPAFVGFIILIERGGISQRFLSLGIGGAVVLVMLCLFCGILLYRGRKWGTNEEMAAIQTGLISRNTVYVTRRKVQWSRLSQSWFQRQRRLATLRIRTAGGQPGQGMSFSVIDLELSQGQCLLTWAWPPLAH